MPNLKFLNLLKAVSPRIEEALLSSKAAKIEKNVADTEAKVAEWAKKKGLPYRKTSDIPIEKSEIPFDPNAKQTTVKDILKEKEEVTELADPSKLNAIMGVGAIPMVSQENKESNMYEKLKNALSSGLQSVKDYNERTQKKAEEGYKAMGVEPLDEDLKDLAMQAGFASPSLGLGAATEKAGPELLRQFLKSKKGK